MRLKLALLVATALLAAPAPALTQRPARPRGWYCAVAQGTLFTGYCVRDRAGCDEVRERSLRQRLYFGSCAPQPTAWCVRARRAGRAIEDCAPSRQACEQSRDALLYGASSAGVSAVSACVLR
jgi:hypothetical protein